MTDNNTPEDKGMNANDKILPELKPCPFCGGEAEIQNGNNGSGLTYDCMVGCHNEECPNAPTAMIHPEYEGGTEDDAIEAWNTRTPAEPIAFDARGIAIMPKGLTDAIKAFDKASVINDTSMIDYSDTAALAGAAKAYAAICADPQAGEEEWRGICKLVEEQGEVLQLIGKLMAYPRGDHPDGKGNLKDRLHEELADLEAASQYFIKENGFDEKKISVRSYGKFRQFKQWIMSGIIVPALQPAKPDEEIK